VDTTGDEGNVAVLTTGDGFAGAKLVTTAMTGGADATGPFGRAYFLGAFHSESGGSTMFSEAGLAEGQAHPIIRGILFSPQGVNLGLSSVSAGITNNEPQSINAATGEFGSDAGDDGGWMTGSVDIGAGKQEFVMLLNGHAKSLEYPNILSASFDPNAANYFWNVFNTDPTLVEKAGHYLKDYWNVYPSHTTLTGSKATYSGAKSGTKHELAFLLTGSQARNVGTAAVPNYENYETRFKTAFSPWVLSQKFGGSAKNLFKVHALDDGAVANNKFKISIENIVKSNNEAAPYGSFDLAVRQFEDDDDNPVVFERFVKLSLNPGSERYISRVIGDRYAYYDFDKNEGAQKLVIEGTHNNASKYIRVSVDSQVRYATMEREALPCGFRGHHHLVTSGSNFLATTAIKTGDGGSVANVLDHTKQLPVPMRDSIHLGQVPKKRANASLYWGVQFQVKDSVKEPNKNRNLDKSLEGFTCWYPNHRLDWQNVWVGDNAGALDANDTVLDSDRFNNNKFTLENVQVKTSSVKDIPSSKDWQHAVYRRDGVKTTTDDLTLANSRFLDVSKDFGELSVKKYLKFSFFVQGGFDGLNPFDEEKAKLTDTAARREMTDSLNQKGVKDSTIAAYRKAIDVMEEKSDVDIQLMAIPGIRVKEVTDYAIDSVETRFDAMLIMDLTEYDNTISVVTSSAEQMISVSNTVEKFLSRNLDTSFAAAYFPDVVITDPATLTNVKCPPSVAVLGAFSLNDAVAHPWYAPAGFTRGALSSVIESQVKLSRTNLDDLYEADINPITAFPHTPGVVVFGQKTLQAHASALDRVNVRRLLIEIRRQVKRIGNTLLFEPNREDTLARFSNAVNPVLQRIQAQQGLDRFKVVIDTTTTTQADVENNTLRGKIFLQPTRAVEFISLDFVITNAGTEV
jgi:phage tail sheath protein FI